MPADSLSSRFRVTINRTCPWQRAIALCAAGGLLLGMTLVCTAGPSADKLAVKASPDTTIPLVIGGPDTIRPDNQYILREGTAIVEEMGQFRLDGKRVTFVATDGKRSLIGLENLNLDRIARTVADHPERLQWKVSGTITEYQGNNYLLVGRAILRDSVQFEQGEP